MKLYVLQIVRLSIIKMFSLNTVMVYAIQDCGQLSSGLLLIMGRELYETRRFSFKINFRI
jgi:hypothetical protein